MFSGENFFPTRLIFQYMKEFSKSDKLRAFIAPKMTALTTLFDKNIKYAVYTGEDIHGIYCYLEMIGYPTTLTTSGQLSHHYSPSYSINNDAETLQPIIAALRTRQRSICECYEIIVYKSDACTIRGPKFLPPGLRRNMKWFNTVYGDEPN